MKIREEKCIIIGAGPCGLSCAIYLQDKGIQPLIIEKGNVVQALYNYPTHQQFFSSSVKLEIGDMPFLTENPKPKRNQALVYYREVAKRKKLRINAFEEVVSVEKQDNGLFLVKTEKDGQALIYQTPYVIIATGYYDHPNYMGIPGEDLPKVHHYFKEAHPFFDQDVVVIGGKNSAVDAAMELHRADARVTVLYRGTDYSPSVKPWILPEFQSLVRNDYVTMHFNTEVVEIKPHSVRFKIDNELKEIKNDIVFAMTGYHPDHAFLKNLGVGVDAASGRPIFNPDTMETNIPGVFIAGVIAAGNNANEIFIENGRFHGGLIAETISGRS